MSDKNSERLTIFTPNVIAVNVNDQTRRVSALEFYRIYHPEWTEGRRVARAQDMVDDLQMRRWLRGRG